MDSMTKGMSPIVQTVSGWVKGFILVFGIYLVLYGHLTPGGGFGGGVVLAMALVLLVLAHGKEEGLRRMPMHVAGELDSAAVWASRAEASGVEIPAGIRSRMR